MRPPVRSDSFRDGTVGSVMRRPPIYPSGSRAVVQGSMSHLKKSTSELQPEASSTFPWIPVLQDIPLSLHLSRSEIQAMYMCVCVYICVCVCPHLHMSKKDNTYMHIYLSIYDIYIYIYIYTSIKYIHIHIQFGVNRFACVCVVSSGTLGFASPL